MKTETIIKYVFLLTGLFVFCSVYGYDITGNNQDGYTLPEIEVTPDDPYDWGLDDDWWRRDYDDWWYEEPDDQDDPDDWGCYWCGQLSCNGECRNVDPDPDPKPEDDCKNGNCAECEAIRQLLSDSEGLRSTNEDCGCASNQIYRNRRCTNWDNIETGSYNSFSYNEMTTKSVYTRNEALTTINNLRGTHNSYSTYGFGGLLAPISQWGVGRVAEVLRLPNIATILAGCLDAIFITGQSNLAEFYGEVHHEIAISNMDKIYEIRTTSTTLDVPGTVNRVEYYSSEGGCFLGSYTY